MNITLAVDNNERYKHHAYTALVHHEEMSMDRPSSRELTAAHLRSVLDYEPDTGIFRWKAKVAKGTRIGSVAGEKLAKNGYRYVSLEYRDHLAQRLAWLHVHGEWPLGRIRFRDGDKANCRIENLTDTQVSVPNSGFDQRTPEGRAAYQRAARAANPDRFRHFELKKKFDIDLADYQKMFVAQGGVCGICRKPEAAKRAGKDLWLAVDHDHATGAVRGLLCSNCNRGIGCFGDNIETLEAAIVYVREHAAATTNIVPFKIDEGTG